MDNTLDINAISGILCKQNERSERAHLLAHCRTLEELLGIAEQQEELAKKTKAELKRQIGRVKKMLESKA